MRRKRLLGLTSRIALLPWLLLASGLPLLACPTLTQEKPHCCHRKTPQCPITPAIDHCPLFLDDAKPEDPSTFTLIATPPPQPFALEQTFAYSPGIADHSATPDQSNLYLLLRVLRN